LNHISSLFCSVFFGGSVLPFAQANLDHDPPILGFHCSWDDRCAPPHSVYFLLKWGLMNFFAWASLEPQSSNLSLPRNLG
jgi:hypothetical protein